MQTSSGDYSSNSNSNYKANSRPRKSLTQRVKDKFISKRTSTPNNATRSASMADGTPTPRTAESLPSPVSVITTPAREGTDIDTDGIDFDDFDDIVGDGHLDYPEYDSGKLPNLNRRYSLKLRTCLFALCVCCVVDHVPTAWTFFRSSCKVSRYTTSLSYLPLHDLLNRGACRNCFSSNVLGAQTAAEAVEFTKSVMSKLKDDDNKICSIEKVS